MSRPPASEIASLETLRQRLHSLTASLRKLADDLARTQAPLLPLENIAAALGLASYHLQQTWDQVAAQHDFFDNALPYPLPSFPGIEHEALVAQLLRKRLDVDIADWLAKARADAVAAPARGLSLDDQVALWAWAADKAQDEVEGAPRGWDYTIEEVVNGIENVATSLQRKLYAGGVGDDADDEDDSGEDEDEDEADKGAQDPDAMHVDKPAKTAAPPPAKPPPPPMAIEDVLWFMTRGERRRAGGA